MNLKIRTEFTLNYGQADTSRNGIEDQCDLPILHSYFRNHNLSPAMMQAQK